MLSINPLQPPRPFLALDLASTKPALHQGMGHGCLVSAEDYDPTGILAGVDPCESRYWWMPELHSDRPARGETVDRHAARRSTTRPPAAA